MIHLSTLPTEQMKPTAVMVTCDSNAILYGTIMTEYTISRPTSKSQRTFHGLLGWINMPLLFFSFNVLARSTIDVFDALSRRPTDRFGRRSEYNVCSRRRSQCLGSKFSCRTATIDIWRDESYDRPPLPYWINKHHQFPLTRFSSFFISIWTNILYCFSHLLRLLS